MRELSHTLSKLGQLQAPPAGVTKSSGSARKKFANARAAVRHFVGPDVLRALLAFDVYNTTLNIVWLQFVASRAVHEQRQHTIAEAQH